MRAAHLALPAGTSLARVLDRAPKLSDVAQLVEVRQGVASAERQAIEVAGPIADAATSWGELHRNLAVVGMRYRVKGTGAVIQVGVRQAAKASVYRGTTMATLTKRLGHFVPPDPALEVVPRLAQPAPGVDDRLQSAVRVRHAESTQARTAYDRKVEAIAHAPVLAEALFGRRPRVGTCQRL